mgnify:FL=1
MSTVRSLEFGPCIFCGKDGSDVWAEGGGYHTACLTCPKCGDNHFHVWDRTRQPIVARCLNCLALFLPGSSPTEIGGRNWKEQKPLPD